MKTTEFSNRYSPVTFKSLPNKIERRDGWEVVLEYENQGKGPFLIDLSHVSKWDVQDDRLSEVELWGPMIPELPGQCSLQNGTVLCRMNSTQAVMWLLTQRKPTLLQKPACTDVTDAYALMAILAKDVFPIMEKVTPLDLSTPGKTFPFLLQGPAFHVRCAMVMLGEKEGRMAVLLACSRGYGQSIAEAIIDVGKEWDVRPGGENAFFHWWNEGRIKTEKRSGEE
jgi:hypothetical protein